MRDETSTDTVSASLPAPDRVVNADPHDFAGLYMRHRASFTLHARRYLRDGRDADEVVQEAFLRLFLALPELETELQALAYCRRTITNLCIDRYRAQARRPSLVDLDSCGAAELADEEVADPVVRAEDAATVREALSLLSPLHRAALVKREIEEKPFPVIAEELDIAEDSVKHVLFRARRALRRILATTSLAPGSDAEISGALSKVARAGSGGVAGFLVLLFLSLGTGPDLRAIPVVGADLPDLLPVTELATGVVGAVESVVHAAAGAVSGGGKGSDAPTEPAEAADPVPVASTSASPTAASTVVSPSPTAVPTTSGLATATASPAATATSPATPTSSPSPETTATAEPTPTATETAEPTPEPSIAPTTSTTTAPGPEQYENDGPTNPEPTVQPAPRPTLEIGTSLRTPVAETTP